ncbi:MAG TPA: STAS domain-containing protein [Anaeromyxobacter sp.]|jgi:hypothetical protein|nr:STAS domain-containing protein [Anaeromyxobacter sp.]
MPGACTIEMERESGRTVFRVSGVFDRSSAAELRRRLDAEDGADVILDFSLVREFADLGVAALASELGAGRRLRLRGLRQHQLRIFRYFGVDIDALQGAVLH